MDERVRQVSEHRWSFEPPTMAPMKGLCSNCGRPVTILRPRVVDIVGGRYAVAGICQDCGADISLRLP